MLRRTFNHCRLLSKLNVTLSIATLLVCLAHATADSVSDLPGRCPTKAEAAAVLNATKYLYERKANAWANLIRLIDKAGKIRVGTDDDTYFAQETKNGDTPYAYTLPTEPTLARPFGPQFPVAIVLAPKWFDTSLRSRASLLVHEAGHWKAYLVKGLSDEYDGYKAQYDANPLIGLDQSDSLPYFCMLDGVAENVVKRAPEYGKKPDVADYIAGR